MMPDTAADADQGLLPNRLVIAFLQLTGDERRLLTCALAGNHPEKLAKYRMPMLRALAKADGLVRRGLGARVVNTDG